MVSMLGSISLYVKRWKSRTYELLEAIIVLILAISIMSKALQVVNFLILRSMIKPSIYAVETAIK